MNKKILIIGQAPPNKDQKVPYDTTMLYSWLSEIGISKEEAQDLFLFDAVYNKFPGYNDDGKGHKVPSLIQITEYYNAELKQKIENSERVWLLGNVAKEFIMSTSSIQNKKVLCTMHPSRMNYNRYMSDKDNIITKLKAFIFS